MDPLAPPDTPLVAYSAFIVVQLIKLGGLAVGLHEAFFVGERDPLVFAFAALGMAGAQTLDTALASFFGGFAEYRKDRP